MLRPALVAACCLLCLCPWARAQDVTGARAGSPPKGPPPAGSVAAAERPAAGGQVEESGVPVYYLKDERGKLVPVLMPLKDFDELYKLKHQLAQGEQQPRYSIQQVSASGTIAGSYAELTIQFRVFVRENQWTRVPLRLNQALLREPAQYQGQGQHVFCFEADADGHVAYLRGVAGPSQQHQLTLKVLVPTAVLGEETRLRLTVPRAAASELKLKVPLPDALAKVPEGASLQSAKIGNSETEFTVRGLAGDFEMTWSKPGARIVETPAVLETVAAVAVRVESRSLETEATLSVRSSGGPFSQFRVRLPQEADLAPGSPAGYVIVPIEKIGPAGRPAERVPRQQVVEVRLAEPTCGPVEVRLQTSRTLEPGKPGPWELAGFEIVGGARQSGTTSVAVVGDWQPVWGFGQGVRQIEPPPATARRKDPLAAFEYFAQPYSLTLRLAPRKTRISVEPEYLLLVDDDQMRLEANLKYNVRGGKVSAVDVTMPDWQIDEVGPDDQVADGGPQPAGTAISVPLLQPATGQFEVRIRAHRSLAPGAQAASATLPELKSGNASSAAVVVLPAVVVVLPAEDVELVPNSEAMSGLIRQGTEVPLELWTRLTQPSSWAPTDSPPRRHDALFYRSEAPKAVFAAELRHLAQQVNVTVAGQVEIRPEGIQVGQKLAYTILHKPLDSFLLDVPRTLVESGRWELRHEGQVVKPVLVQKPANDGSATVRMRVPLPKACIDSCHLTVRYLLPLATAADRPSSVAVPLVMPCDGTLLANRVFVTAQSGIQAQPAAGPWTALEAQPARPGQPTASTRCPPLQLSADERVPQVELEVQRLAEGEPAIVVERAWVQTWLSGTDRQDRAVFQFTGNGRDMEVLLPAGADRDTVTVLLDGKRARARPDAEGVLILSQVGDAGSGRHVLEVRYHFPGFRDRRGHLAIDFPQLGRDTWVRRMYWQLVLPRDEHVIGAPAGLAGEYTWGWTGLFWGRMPLLDQTQLQSWAGSEDGHQAPMPASSNCYLFSGMGSVAHCELRTAGRTWIVLAASGAALVMGLLLIYVPVARHPVTLLAAVVLLAACVPVAPDMALLAAQAASLGLALALVATLLAYGVRRRPPAVVALPERGSSVVENGPLSTRTEYQIPAAIAADHEYMVPAAPTDSLSAVPLPRDVEP